MTPTAVSGQSGSHPRSGGRVRRRPRNLSPAPAVPTPPGRAAASTRTPRASGGRWRFVYRRSDGTQTTKRGFTSERAARDARRRLVEQVERGEVRHTKETFGGLLGAVAGAPPAVPGAGHLERL